MKNSIDEEIGNDFQSVIWGNKCMVPEVIKKGSSYPMKYVDTYKGEWI